jgi:hypothetical protein
VAHDRGERAAARQVHRAPDRAERAGDDGGIEALQRVAHPEAEAGDEQPHPRLAEIAAKAVQQERALQFLAHAAGDDHTARKHPQAAPVPISPSSGLSGTLCSAGRKR